MIQQEHYKTDTFIVHFVRSFNHSTKLQEGQVTKVEGEKEVKADVTINLTDEVFQQLSDGRLNGQKVSLLE